MSDNCQEALELIRKDRIRWIKALKAGKAAIAKVQKDYAWEAKIYKLYGGSPDSYRAKAAISYIELEVHYNTLEEIIQVLEHEFSHPTK